MTDKDREIERRKAPTSVGRTSGGGSLGHVQPDEGQERARIRNNPEPPNRSDDPGEPDPGQEP